MAPTPAATGCEDRKIDLDATSTFRRALLSHLSSLIPSQRPTQLLRQGDNRSRNGVAHRLGTMSGECGSVLHASLVAMFRHARQVQQQSEARHAFYQGADRGTAKAQDEIPFPVARHGAINCARRRWLIMISGEMKVLPRPRARALGIRNTRPVAASEAPCPRRRAPVKWQASWPSTNRRCGGLVTRRRTDQRRSRGTL